MLTKMPVVDEMGPKMSKFAKHNTVFQVKAFHTFLLLWNFLSKHGLFSVTKFEICHNFLIASSSCKSTKGLYSSYN